MIKIEDSDAKENEDSIYQALWDDAIMHIRSGSNEIDNHLHNLDEDTRQGLSLIFHPEKTIKSRIASFLSELMKIEPEHYYQPLKDSHITALSIISCRPDFCFDPRQAPQYAAIIANAIQGFKTSGLVSDIQFKGVSFTKDCIILKGYAKNNWLNVFRKKLREGFARSQLENTMDTRYSLRSAHCTIVRFKHHIKQPAKLIELVSRFEQYDFGQMRVKEIHFVENDWYQQSSKTSTLATLKI